MTLPNISGSALSCISQEGHLNFTVRFPVGLIDGMRSERGLIKMLIEADYLPTNKAYYCLEYALLESLLGRLPNEV